MYYDLLIESINKYVSLSEAEQTELISILKQKKLKRKHFLNQEGEVHQHLAFVTKGCLRSYYIDENGVEHILQFAPQGWWIGDMQSLLNNTPAVLNIDAIEESEMILLKRSNLENLFLSIPSLERFFRIISERSMATFQQRLIDSLSLTALKRYTNFCERYPSLIQTLPQKYIASYIGITPEFFSKMLSQPAKKI